MAFSVTQTSSPAWRYWAQQSPFSIALMTEKETLTWQAVAFRVAEYASALLQQGLVAGDVLTLVGKNRVEMLFFYLAAQEIGVTVALTMPQPMDMLKGKLETLYQAQQRRFVWFSAEPSERDSQFAPSAITLLEVPSACCHIPGRCDAPAYQHHALASIVFTSGTTGLPKAVVHTHVQHFASAEGLLSEFHYAQGDTWLLSLPLYHVSGLAIVYRWLYSGASLKIGTGQLAQDIEGVSHASLVATQLKRLLDEKVTLQLTHVLLGGSHVEHSLALAAQRQGIETWLGYGMTEAASTVTAKRIDAVSNAGHLLKHRAITIKEQRIYIGGATLASGYFCQGAVTPLVDEQGWFDSKDLGKWQGNELQIIGRADNQFISGGENIHCEEIEAALNRVEGVVQSIVVPVEDAEFGHRPVAVIQADVLLTKAQYQDHLQLTLEKFKWPIAYYLMPSALTEGGIKISRKAVKEWLLANAVS